jgi:hypothetical protein
MMAVSSKQEVKAAEPATWAKVSPCTPFDRVLKLSLSLLFTSCFYFLTNVTYSPCHIKGRAGASRQRRTFLLLPSPLRWVSLSLSDCSSSTFGQTWLAHTHTHADRADPEFSGPQGGAYVAGPLEPRKTKIFNSSW